MLKLPSHPYKTEDTIKIPKTSFPKQLKIKHKRSNKMLHCTYLIEVTKHTSVIHQDLPLKIFLRDSSKYLKHECVR